MPLVLNDRVQQIATANTTVSFTLGSSVTGFQSFAVIGNGNTTYYSAFDSSGNWEVGLGTYATIGPTLTRNSIFSSSNSNAAVTFIGNVNVFVTYPSSKSVYGDGTTLVSPSGTILPVVSGGTGVTTSTGTGSVVLSASPTLTGTVLIGSTSGTSTVTLGRSSNTSTVNINTGSSTLIATRTVNIATNGSGTDIVNIGRITASDGETTINIGTQVRSNNQTYVNINTGAIGGNAYTTIGSDDGGSLTTINGPFYASGDSNYQILLGSTTSTGPITIGQSTDTQTTDIQAGATASGRTKTINIGTGGLAGSTTAITVGATTGTSVTANGTWTYSTPLAATNMVQATTSTSGYLSSTDWNTFNSKGSGSVTSVTATSPVTSTGGVTPIIAMPAATTTVDGYLTSTDWTTFNNKGSGSVTSVGGTGSVNGVTLTGTVTTSGNLTLGGTLSGIGNSSLTNSSITINGTPVSLGGSVTTPQGTITSVTGTSPISSSGGTTPAISIAQADTSTNGFLSSTDWNTFNSKGSGSVTSVGGTGTVSGISLSGTVTSSGDLTLGGALDLSSPPTIGNTTPNTGAFTSVTTPSVTATTTDLTLSAISTGAVNLNTAGGTQFKALNRASADIFIQAQGGVGGVSRASIGTGGTGASGFNIYNAGAIRFQTGGNGVNEQLVVADTASAVNFVQVTGSATGGSPTISAQGSDAVVSLALRTKGTGSNITPQYDGSVFFQNLSAQNQFRVFNTVSSVNYLQTGGAIAGATPTLSVEGSDTNIGLNIQSKLAAPIKFFTSGGFEQMRIANTASAVNYVQVTGSATGNNPTVSVTGSDSNVSANYVTKGAGYHAFLTNTNTVQFQVAHTGSSANYNTVSGGAIGFVPRMYAQGTDTNISMAFQPKGTGAIDLAAGSSGVNISNGGTITAITRTVGGSGYTGLITATISAPTTAGGVQATVAIGTGAIGQAIVSGGTGYTAGNILNVVGGTIINSTLQQIRVDTVNGSGVILTVSVAGFGQYTTLPTNPVSVTGGSGSGATFNLSNFSFVGSSITNAGSGYIEQPTVTFSGGGGSGAAAFATIGSNTRLTTHGNYFSIFSSNSGSESLRLYGNDAGGGQVQQSTGPGLVIIPAQSAYGSARIGTQQTFHQLEIGSAINTAGAAAIGFNTGVAYAPASGGIVGGSRQAVVSHTASAVNYVQVTGAATTAAPVIQAQGSDANIELRLVPKGTSGIALMDSAGLTAIRAVQRATSGDTFLDVQRAVGFVDLIATSGVADSDIRFTPKGAGRVRFGTYTASVLTPTGYIEVKDSGGTLRRLLVG